MHALRTCLPVNFVSRVEVLLEGVEGDRRVLHGVGVSTHDDVNKTGTINQIERAATVHLLCLADSAIAPLLAAVAHSVINNVNDMQGLTHRLTHSDFVRATSREVLKVPCAADALHCKFTFGSILCVAFAKQLHRTMCVLSSLQW